MNEQIDWSKAPEGATHCWAQAQDFYKVDNGNWMVWYGNEMRWAKSTIAERWSGLVERPTTPSWSGEGLPPVGVVCEMHYCGEWEKTEILCIGVKHVFIRQIAVTGEAFECSLNLSACQFRPIRTPEQIAADARRKAIDEMVKALGMDEPGTAEYIRCGLIYDAGFRKP